MSSEKVPTHLMFKIKVKVSIVNNCSWSLKFPLGIARELRVEFVNVVMELIHALQPLF
jgi:hypothetical protein